MRDSLIHDLLAYHGSLHEQSGYLCDVEEFAKALGVEVHDADSNFMTPSGVIYVSGMPGTRERRKQVAHELGHNITNTGDDKKATYEYNIRFYHASAPDLEEHIEILTNLTDAQLRMPDPLVRLILEDHNYRARAVWELSQAAEVELFEALDRLVFFDENERVGAFITNHAGEIIHAQKHGFWLPSWKGDFVPEPHVHELEGLSVFEIPGQPRCYICLKRIDPFEAA